MCHGVDSHLPQLLLDVGVPVVLDLVISSTREMRCDLGPSEVAHKTLASVAVESNHQITQRERERERERERDLFPS